MIGQIASRDWPPAIRGWKKAPPFSSLRRLEAGKVILEAQADMA